MNYHVQFVRGPWTSTLPEEVVVCVSSTIQSDIHIPNEKEKWRKVRAIFRNFSFIICNIDSSFKFEKAIKSPRVTVNYFLDGILTFQGLMKIQLCRKFEIHTKEIPSKMVKVELQTYTS